MYEPLDVQSLRAENKLLLKEITELRCLIEHLNCSLAPSRDARELLAQTHSEDLRVNTRIKDDSQTQSQTQSKIVKPERLQAAPQALVAAPVSGGKGKASGSVKATLAKHCRKVGTQRSIKASNKGVVARRLKDKLQILKQKLAEDENTLSDIKSGNLK